MKVFLLDNYDSFTFILKDYIEQCGVTCMVKRNDDPLVNREFIGEFDAVVLSPGPGVPAHAGKLMQVIDEQYARLPLLGVCLGHQAIGEYFGAALCRSVHPKHGKTDEIITSVHPLFSGMVSPFTATRYHSLVLENVVDPLEKIAWTGNSEIMAIAHKLLPVFGIQFHPESCLTNGGIRILENFLKLAKGLS